MSMKQTRAPRAPQHGQKGIALFEALLSILLLSISLLGAASVQVNSVRQANGISARTLADAYARKMVEAMRSNRAGIISGVYNSVTATVADPGCMTSGCSTGTAIGQVDINAFYIDVAKLPAGTGRITGGGPQTNYTVSVSWLDPATQTTQTWSLIARLP